MNYRITITRSEPNPNYATEIEQYEQANRYNRNNYDEIKPRPMSTIDALIAELTPEQFEAIRKAVLANF
jgi:hypothetical protein